MKKPITRKPLLCLDTNASIDIGVVKKLERTGIDIGVVKNLERIGESLAELLNAQSGKINEFWKDVSYDEAIKTHIDKTLRDRNNQLQGTARFLQIARGKSIIRLPEFGKIEHARVRPDKGSIPPLPVEKITPDVHRISLEVFSRTTLSLQDSLILASAIGMRADALVSNDDDFKRAFNGDARLVALRITGKPLLLLDHREFAGGPPPIPGAVAEHTLPQQPKQPTLHSMLLRSLHRYYGTHPRFGRPLWIDRRGGKHGWYLAYHHPLPAGTMEPSLVPGRDSISIIDEHSWMVCKIGGVYFFNESYPDGVTRESVERTMRSYSGAHRPKNLERYLRLPGPKKPGYVRVAIELDGFPPSWKNWRISEGERSGTKRSAPVNARGFVETEAAPNPGSAGTAPVTSRK